MRPSPAISIPFPHRGETIDLHPWYVQTEQPDPEWDGGDRGWYVVHENVEGSAVYFDRKYMGEIADGILRVEVNLTEPAFTEYRVVEPDGWTSHTMQVQHIPPAGGTVHYYAWVQPAPHPSSMLPGPDTPEPLPATPAANSGNTTDDEGVKTPGFGIAVLLTGLVITACAMRRW
ncbi:hypothetical protein [Methanogenium sp. MK-MG]|uniref:hypothetical protein n=1 Tax=Methanogenium sp. MK-MG TaxID=2599926 RepID=UPI0013E9A822|nr:hypothetical protein [Methanogenium sp. MK-MG]KAF1074373.1 hypothetical protein MKMG_01961 [Methanogenium sp. MK-MG]